MTLNASYDTGAAIAMKSTLATLLSGILAAALPMSAQATPPPPQPICEPVSPDVTSEALGRRISTKAELREGECAAQNLAERGADAIPTVLDLLRLRDTHVDMLALTALAGIGPQARAALPDLMDRLRQASTLEDKYLYDAVVALGPAARPAIPLLIARSRAGAHPYYLQHAVWPLHALGRLGKHDPDRVVSYLVALLLDRENDQPVLDALADIGHDAHAAVPAILVALERATISGSREDGAAALDALIAVGAPAESVPVLKKLLHDPVLGGPAAARLATIAPVEASARLP